MNFNEMYLGVNWVGFNRFSSQAFLRFRGVIGRLALFLGALFIYIRQNMFR